MNTNSIISAAIVSLGIASGGFMLGQSLENSRKPIRTVTVKGLAEQNVKADLGFWPIRFVASGPSLDVARANLEKSEGAIRAFLKQRGFDDGEIELQNVRVEDRFAGYGGGNFPAEVRYNLNEDILVTSKNVEALAEAARDIGELLKQGVEFSSDSWSGGPSFVFTGIADLKTDMLTEATTRAREAAQQFATESQSNVGNIQNANQGVFEILPAVDIPNDRPDRQIDKRVRVVSTITYFLVD